MTARWPLLLLLPAAVAATACGDNLAGLGDGGGGGTLTDAAPGADAAPGGDAAPVDGSITGATGFAVATDYATAGVATTVSIPGLEVTTNAVEGVASTDPVVRRIGDRLYIVNRFGQDNVTVLDAGDLSLVGQISTGPGSNPQDVAVVGDLLFVAAFGGPGLVVIDITRPDDGVIETIDLSGLDPDDGLPNCGTVAAVGDRVVAVCGVLDDANFLTPRGPGVAAIIDPAGRAAVDTVTMTQIRPLGLAQVMGGAEPALLVATVADFSDLDGDGCVERITVGEGGGASACLVDNADLGGFVSALAWDEAGDRLWMTVTTSFDENDFGPHGDLVSTSGEGGDLQRAALAEEVRPMDLALCPSGHLIVSDATRGVRVLAPGAAEELTSAALDIGLPPVSNGLACH
ncbi:MAG TPA: hypothetical protein VK698_18515 [Kofleriaceae bacterium]|nr:hypothetical protein [Kofleriaceae bacterium]